MRRKKKSTHAGRVSPGFNQLPDSSDFYAGAPSEKPLCQDKPTNGNARIRKMGRHQAVAVRRKENLDPRERMALLAIQKSVVIIVLLGIVFFLLWKGIKNYEESVYVDSFNKVEVSPVMRDVELVEDFNVENQDARELFAERVKVWKEANRLVRSADGLLLRNNFDQAIERCQDALRVDPVHMGALERLGNLYFKKGMNVESINSYIKLLSFDLSREDLQEKLIQVLDAHNDPVAVIYMANWYLEQNNYDADVQRYLAHAYFKNEDFATAAIAYDHVLKDSPSDTLALEQQAEAYMQLEEYGKALNSFDKLHERNYRDANYYHRIAVCNAQLGHSAETVQILGKAAHLFGQNVVVDWVKDPRLNPVREDQAFRAFADRVGGEEFRKWLEKVAKTMDGTKREGVAQCLP